MCTPPRRVPARGVDLERLLELAEDVVEAARLDAVAESSRCCRASDRRSTARGGRRCARPRPAAAASRRPSSAPMRWISVRRPGSSSRIEHVDQAQQPVRRHRRADLDADRVADAAEVLDVRAVELRRAHADPREVRRQVVPAPLARHLRASAPARRAAQRLVGRVEVDAVEVVRPAIAGQRLHEAQRVADRLRRCAGTRRRAANGSTQPRSQYSGWCRSAKPPSISARTKFSVSAARSYASQHAARIGLARLRREFRRIDDVAAVARQRHAVARLGVGRARLGVLAGEAADAHHRLPQAVHEHEAHLQQDLEPVRDHRRLQSREALGAVAALQQEAPAFLRPRRAAA